MITDISPLQLEKEPMPIVVTELGIVTDVNPLHPMKVLFPILVTEFGIIMEVSPVEPLNALAPIEVTVLGITVFWQPAMRVFVEVSMMELQLPLLSKCVFPLETTIEVSPPQEPKASLPILTTEFGIVTEVKLLQL